jgi:nucleotide-binding universal stress UspA family protein
MIIIPSVEATVLGELRTQLPVHSITVLPEDYEPPEGGIQTIGAAYAPTPEGREALRVAAELARAGSLRLRAITVLDPKRAEEQSLGLGARMHGDVDSRESIAARHRLEEEAELQEAVDSLGDDLDSEIDVLFNHPAEGLRAAGRHVDLLVMGSRGHGPVRAAIFGSVSHSLAQEAPCPVLILPRG